MTDVIDELVPVDMITVLCSVLRATEVEALISSRLLNTAINAMYPKPKVDTGEVLYYGRREDGRLILEKWEEMLSIFCWLGYDPTTVMFCVTIPADDDRPAPDFELHRTVEAKIEQLVGYVEISSIPEARTAIAYMKQQVAILGEVTGRKRLAQDAIKSLGVLDIQIDARQS